MKKITLSLMIVTALTLVSCSSRGTIEIEAAKTPSVTPPVVPVVPPVTPPTCNSNEIVDSGSNTCVAAYKVACMVGDATFPKGFCTDYGDLGAPNDYEDTVNGSPRTLSGNFTQEYNCKAADVDYFTLMSDGVYEIGADEYIWDSHVAIYVESTVNGDIPFTGDTLVDDYGCVLLP